MKIIHIVRKVYQMFFLKDVQYLHNQRHYCSNQMYLTSIYTIVIINVRKYFILIVHKYAIKLDNKKRILVIDDELDICIMLKVVLESNGFIVNYYHKPIIALDEL